MDTASFPRLFANSQKALMKNLEGITHDESLIQPIAGNCLNWVVGHLVWGRNKILEILKEPPAIAKETAERYKRGSDPMQSAGEATPFADLLSALERSQKQVQEALAPDSQKAPALTPEDSENLGTLFFHEGYHVGQTGILRRLIGKEGAIR
ncbi:MAG: DinB family protein [Acidobacteriota bacterium]